MQIFAKGAAAFSCKIGRRVLTPVLLRPIAPEVAFVYVATEDDTLFPDMPLLAPVVWTRETVTSLDWSYILRFAAKRRSMSEH